MRRYSLFFLVVGLMMFCGGLRAQYIPTHISNVGVYEFLDELADLQIIDLNTSMKPYSRAFIEDKLNEAKEQEDQLSARQVKELEFYLKDYRSTLNESSGGTAWAWINKDADKRLHFFDYRDSAFSISVDPILGTNIWANENGSFYHWWNGIETHAAYKNFGLFVSLRDNHESVQLTDRDYMNQRIGGATIKTLSTGFRDYAEIRAGMTYGWEWGHVGLLMDQFSWGDAYNGSNIFSGRTPAFARIDLQMNPVDWFQFNYVQGWLVSEVVDSSFSFWVNSSYGSEYREVYHPKFLAANMFSFKPFNHFYVAVGNSVIHDYRSAHAAFFIPVMFWKALDSSLNAGIDDMNSQLFVSLSSRNLKGFHFYGSAFIDEIQVGRIFRDGEYNFSSFKAGLSASRLEPFTLQLEYTWSNALVFRHFVTTTTFESNHYNLGHYLEDNARDLYASIEYRPIRTMKIKAYYNKSEKGPDNTLLGTQNRVTITPLDPVVWSSIRIGISTSLQLINDLYLKCGYEWRDVSGEQEWIDIWTPEVYWGKTGTMSFGINYGF